MKHVLVVDDEPGMLSLLSRVLSAMWCRVTTAPDGPAALAALGSEPVDLLVTDYLMPDMNGRELITALRAQRPGLKALVVTGSPSIAEGQDREWWHKQPHLEKPFSVRSLQDAVIGLIGPPKASASNPKALPRVACRRPVRACRKKPKKQGR